MCLRKRQGVGRSAEEGWGYRTEMLGGLPVALLGTCIWGSIGLFHAPPPFPMGDLTCILFCPDIEAPAGAVMEPGCRGSQGCMNLQ